MVPSQETIDKLYDTLIQVHEKEMSNNLGRFKEVEKVEKEFEVEKHVQRMKNGKAISVDGIANGKAISVDGIANEIIKNDASIRMLTRLYNIFYSENIIPELWKRSLICPIYI